MLSSRITARRIYSAASTSALQFRRIPSTLVAKSIATAALRSSVISSGRQQVSAPINTRLSSLQSHIRNACSCASHNSSISASYVLDGKDKSVMSICQGGAHSKPHGKERDAYRLPTNGEFTFLECRQKVDRLGLTRHVVNPTHYDLVFKTDLEGLTFEGQGIVQYVRR